MKGNKEDKGKDMPTCRICDVNTNNGTNFCSRKHRKQWVEDHYLTKKERATRHEADMMSFGSDFNNETDRQNS